jgi:hypothetical protein
MKWFKFERLDHGYWMEETYTATKSRVKKTVHLAGADGKALCGARHLRGPVDEQVTCKRCAARVEPIKSVVKKFDHALFKNWQEG